MPGHTVLFWIMDEAHSGTSEMFVWSDHVITGILTCDPCLVCASPAAHHCVLPLHPSSKPQKCFKPQIPILKRRTKRSQSALQRGDKENTKPRLEVLISLRIQPFRSDEVMCWGNCLKHAHTHTHTQYTAHLFGMCWPPQVMETVYLPGLLG